jgi:diazepam-binding inhibitor (GABA receptor modulating acyl-CoA-binding protein)
MSAPQSEAFKKAVEDSKKLTSKPGPTELLELYGKAPLAPSLRSSANLESVALYKVGTGEDFTKAEKPGMLDLKASYIPKPYTFYGKN